MPVLQKGNALYPFWGDNVQLITGLDPLGLQVTSEATYSVLLPGISNLTNRIRYFGFYCWLLDIYFRSEKKGNQVEQNRFIRRAELMIAIMMQSERPLVQQITGSDFAAALVNTEGLRIFDLVGGADLDSGSEKTYWLYSSGAFGQYYFGALQALSLTVRNENEEGDIIFNITQAHPRQKVSGRELADAFGERIPEPTRVLFLNCIQKGKLNKKDIPEFIEYFAIDKVDARSREWQLYADLLTDKDHPAVEIEEDFSFHRQLTISALIKNALANDKEYLWGEYIEDCYQKKFNVVNSTDTGWYAYQANEYWQYGCGMIFYAMLKQLEHLQQDQYLPVFIQQFAEGIRNEFNRDEPITVGEWIDGIEKIKEEDIIQEYVDNREYTALQDAKLGFDVLFQLYKNNRDELHQLKVYLNRHHMIRDGNMVDGLLKIENALQLPLRDFIASFIHKDIIRRHQMVALRKMSNTSRLSNKFVIEEQRIRVIDIFPPRNTTPRMRALYNLLSDLKVIDDTGLVSSLHTKFLID